MVLLGGFESSKVGVKMHPVFFPGCVRAWHHNTSVSAYRWRWKQQTVESKRKFDKYGLQIKNRNNAQYNGALRIDMKYMKQNNAPIGIFIDKNI